MFIVVIVALAAFTQGKNTSHQTLGSATSSDQFSLNKYSLTDPDSIWVIINKRNPIAPLDYAPTDLVSIGNGQFLRPEAAHALDQLIKDAKSKNLKLSPISGFRSYDMQAKAYDSEVMGFGQVIADRESARPGYSEHQTGFAVDVGNGECDVKACFGQSKEGQWLAANADKYGFIVRYTKAKEEVTGYLDEPWHIRYIGLELAKQLQSQNIKTLEEFFKKDSSMTY